MTANDNDCRPEFEAWLATCGKSPLMWNTSDAMLAAWAAATRAALATQPAAGEPVAWMTRPRIGSHKGREFICEPDVSLNLDNWEKPFPVYATLPAAAHGDHAVRDEAVLQCLRDLYESAYNDGQNNPNGYSSSGEREDTAQHALRAMRAQAGEGGEP